MTLVQQAITIGLCALATILTRFVPFAVFNENRPMPASIEYLGRVLPLDIFALLVVYCLKDVSLVTGSHGIPEAIGIFVTGALYLWKRQMLIAIAGGTVCYMLLVQLVF